MGIEYIDKHHAKLVITKGSGVNRQRKVKRITYTGKKDAERQFRDFERSVNFSVDGSITVGQLLDWYIDRFKDDGGKETTLTGYTSISKRLSLHFGSRKCKDIGISDVDAYIRKKIQRYKPKTIKNDLSLLSSAYKEAIRHGFLVSNPCEYVKVPKQVKPDIEVLSDMDIRTFIEALDSQPKDFKVMCELALFCGLRRSEVLGLKKQDVGETVTISKVRHRIDGKDITQTPKTKSSVRTLAVPKFIRDDVAELIKEQGTRPYQCDYLILNDFGEPVNPSWVTRHMHGTLKDTGLPQITFHGLRHTYASMLISKGVPISEVSAQLGHASIDITLRTYAHLYRDASTASRYIAGLMEDVMAPNGHQNKKESPQSL